MSTPGNKHHIGGRRRSHGGKLRGGAGAAEYGQSIYGGPGQQHAVSATDNTIVMNKMAGGAGQLMPSKYGGGVYPLTPSLTGGNVLSTVAVPAGLLLANNVFKRGQTMSGFRRSVRFGKSRSRGRSNGRGKSRGRGRSRRR